jgi:hypothetical protein
MRYYFFLVLHVAILTAWYSSPFYLDWRLVIGTVILYHIQIHYWGGCLLTYGQFGKENEGFYYHYLRRLGFTPNRKVLNFILDVIIPSIIIGIALYRRFGV